MNFIDEENAAFWTEHAAILYFGNDLSNVFNAARNSRKGINRALQMLGNELSKGGFTNTWRAPKDHGWDNAGI